VIIGGLVVLAVEPVEGNPYPTLHAVQRAAEEWTP
jgi:hypothetical protein